MDVATATTVYAGSMAVHLPQFRLGSVLATSFTGTLTERAGSPVERIPTPARLLDWFHEYGLAVKDCSPTQLELAKDLRESVHLVATAAALDDPLPSGGLACINEFSAAGGARPVLTPERLRTWRLREGEELEDALGVIAADAIEIISGQRDGRLALCASATCRAAFFDTSRSRSRRWCDMNTCGNRQKKARLNATT